MLEFLKSKWEALVKWWKYRNVRKYAAGMNKTVDIKTLVTSLPVAEESPYLNDEAGTDDAFLKGIE